MDSGTFKGITRIGGRHRRTFGAVLAAGALVALSAAPTLAVKSNPWTDFDGASSGDDAGATYAFLAFRASHESQLVDLDADESVDSPDATDPAASTDTPDASEQVDTPDTNEQADSNDQGDNEQADSNEPSDSNEQGEDDHANQQPEPVETPDSGDAHDGGDSHDGGGSQVDD